MVSNNIILFLKSLLLDITHLKLVLSKLKRFSKAKWKEFGLKCGLYYDTLEAIQANNAGKPRPTEECFRDCVARWLRREDNVKEEGKPTLQRLADIVENIKSEDNHKSK